MNKNLFNTTGPQQTADLLAEYTKYIDETATALIRNLGEGEWIEVSLETQAQQEARWCSWVVSASRRNFAFHQACFALNPAHTMAGVRPTVDTAIIAIAKHIVIRCHELANRVKAAYYRLRFTTLNRMANVSDIDPLRDDEITYQVNSRQDAVRAGKAFYVSYMTMGIAPPPLNVVAYDSDNKELEQKPLEVSEPTTATKTIIESTVEE